MEFRDLLDTLQSKTGKAAKKAGIGYSACCPAHEDQNPSLSVSHGNDGKILLHCFAGCTVDAICAALGLNLRDLFDAAPFPQQEPKQMIYSYRDEHEREIYRKIRIEPGFDGKDKSFYSEHTNEAGQIIRSLQGCRRVLYRLPELLKSISEGEPVFLVEGEKDADKLASHGLTATTSLESLKWPDEFTEILKAADVILLYDLDETGLKRKELLCKALYKKVKRLRVADLPGLKYQKSHGPDISDWLAQGHTTEELSEIVSHMPDYSPTTDKEKIQVINMSEFLTMNLPKREMLLSPFLPSQGLALLYAKRGVGKTHVALGIARAVAAGGSFLKWQAPKPRRVLYIDGEMPAASMQERLRRIFATEESTSALNFLRLITPDLQSGPMPDLSTREGKISIDEFVEESDLIIIDNISSLFRCGIENDAESWQPGQDWALELRRRGKSVLFVHHAGKGGQQRGTSKKEDILDSVINLKHPANYRADQGACFEVVYEKTRHFAGEEAAPFQVQLQENEADGLWSWDITDIQADPKIAAVAELTKKGSTINEIKKETGLSKSQVETRQRKAREQGLLD